jgi:hypothetical protein
MNGVGFVGCVVVRKFCLHQDGGGSAGCCNPSEESEGDG